MSATVGSLFSPLKVEGLYSPMDVDSSNTDPKYWDEVLNKCGLSMNRGKFLKGAELITVGGSAELDSVEASQMKKESGRVTPQGHGPDREGNGEGRS